MTDPRYLWRVFIIIVIHGCSSQPLIAYKTDIYPIMRHKCFHCHLPPHGEGYVATGLNLESYNTLMQGNIYGRVVIPGDSKRSVLNKLVEGRAGEAMRMPHGDAEKLTAKEIEYFRLWVEQGALNN
jgi:hypothetical protein